MSIDYARRDVLVIRIDPLAGGQPPAVGQSFGQGSSDMANAAAAFLATGKLDAKTLQQLGLGSQTAGVAPPMPPVSSSSLQKPMVLQSAPRQP